MTSPARFVAALGLALALTTAGTALAACAAPAKRAEPAAQTAAIPARGADRTPAAAAGGACQLLDFYAVEQFVGVQFEVAAAAQRESTATCVLQRSGASFPDLTLAITTTGADVPAFRAGAPATSVEVAGVGRAAYQLTRPAPAADPAGPGQAVELGWFSRTGQLMVVRYRLPASAAPDEAAAMAPRVLDLAKFLDSA